MEQGFKIRTAEEEKSLKSIFKLDLLIKGHLIWWGWWEICLHMVLMSFLSSRPLLFLLSWLWHNITLSCLICCWLNSFSSFHALTSLTHSTSSHTLRHPSPPYTHTDTVIIHSHITIHIPTTQRKDHKYFMQHNINNTLQTKPASLSLLWCWILPIVASSKIQ